MSGADSGSGCDSELVLSGVDLKEILHLWDQLSLIPRDERKNLLESIQQKQPPQQPQLVQPKTLIPEKEDDKQLRINVDPSTRNSNGSDTPPPLNENDSLHDEPEALTATQPQNPNQPIHTNSRVEVTSTSGLKSLSAVHFHLKSVLAILSTQTTLPTPSESESQSEKPQAPTASKEENESHDPRMIGIAAWLTWLIGFTFPPFNSPTVNECRLRSPIEIVKHVISTPLSLYGKTPQAAKPASWWQAVWTFLGVFTAISCIGILHQYYTNSHFNWPILFASHGALTTIMFVTPASPTAQPYAVYLGTVISTFFAVTIEQNMDTTKYLWLAVALSAAVSITLMELLACSHPPGGALAVLYIAVPTLHVLGYWYIIAALVGSTIVILCSLIFNNFPNTHDRHYPSAWIG